MQNLNKESRHFLQRNYNPEDINKIKKILLDPRYISKSLDIEGRKSIARDILNQRKTLHQIEKDIAEKEELLAAFISKFEQLNQSLKELIKYLDDLENNLLVKIKKFFLGEKVLSQELTQRESLAQELKDVQQKIEGIRQGINELYRQQQSLPSPQELLNSYYEKISYLPLRQEEKRNFLKPEILCQLTLDEYIALWRRLNPYFLSHVTRQGVRDHFSMFSHSAGLSRFHNGFEEILKDDKMLRPPSVMRWGFSLRDKRTIKRLLEEKIFPKSKNAEEAKKNLEKEFNFTIAYAPLYPDKIAVHFACQDVLNEYYGAETNNEIFFIFPVDFIASQYYYAFNSVWVKDFTRQEKDRSLNDVFVWTGNLDNPGVPLDAGIVFIPADALVDPETGSKYASKVENGIRILIEDEVLIERFINWLKGIDDHSDLVELYNLYLKDNREFGNLSNYLLEQMKKLGFDEEMAARLGNEIYQNIRLVLNPTLLNTYFKYEQPLELEEAARVVADNILTATGAKFKKAENPITSEEYWRRYFETYPELKPKHLVFYRGNPTFAVLNFLRENNIGRADTSQTEGVLLGFDDHHITDLDNKNSLAWQGYDDLMKIAEKLIDEYYSLKKDVQND